MNLSTVGGHIYLLELGGNFEFLEFQFVPDALQWDRIPNWVNIPIVGRNNSKKHLTGGEDRLSFTLDFNSLYENDKQDALRKLAWLQSLTFSDGLDAPVRNVKLYWGDADIFRHKVWIMKLVKGRISDFRSNFNYIPTQLIIDIQMELDPQENLRINDIRDFSPSGPRYQDTSRGTIQ